MAKHTFKIGSKAAEAEPGGGGYYDGEKPPAGVYVVTLKMMRLKTNKNGDDMINVLTEIDEPKGEKAAYNGYGIWDNLNVTDEGAGYINSLLDAIGIPRKVLWEQGYESDNQSPPNITKIGTKRPVGIKLRVSTADEEYRGEEKLSVKRYLGLKAGDEDAAEVDEEPTDEEPQDEVDTATETDEDGGEPISDEELEAMTKDELKELCDAWEISYTAKASEATLRKKIKALQDEAAEAAEEAADETAEEAEEAEEESDDESSTYTEDELKEYGQDDLKAILVEQFEVALPKPPIKPRLIKAILAAQEKANGEPPF